MVGRPMKARMAPLLVAGLVLAVTPAARSSETRACADYYPSMGLGPFPPEAETTPFFWGEEGDQGSFSVRWTGIACGQPISISSEYSAVPGSAEPADHTLTQGATPPVCEVGCPNQDSVEFTIHDESEDEAVVEAFSIVLSNTSPSVITPPSSVPFLIVDEGPQPLVAFDELSYSRSETYATMTVPVWRAGSVTEAATVPYTVGPGSSAAVSQDFSVTSPNPLSFGAGDRVEVITLAIVNDELSEPEETVELTLQAPTGATLATPSTKVVSILDNEENVPPRSRFHHPRHKWKYKKSDYRIREFHVFAHDEGGSEVAAVELALRRNLKNGKCAWKTKKGWQKKDCQNRTWLPTKYSEAGDLFYYRMKQLKPSVKTKIKNYSAFSRAIDGAGNVEKEFKKKRNDNTFEIKRKKRG
jgi:Calx-beta domain